MFKNEVPLFIPKQVLKIEMLENLRDFQRNLVNIKIYNYTNGILSGCEIKVVGKVLQVQPGILVYRHQVYLLPEPVSIPYQANDKMTYLKVKCIHAHKEKEHIGYYGRFDLDCNDPNEADEIELGRFWLQTGSELRHEYVDFEDYATVYDTINRINTIYSGEAEERIWPKLLWQFAKEAMMEPVDGVDSAFCFTILRDQETVSRQLVISYLNQKLKSKKTEYSNKEIYDSLVQILHNLKRGISTRSNRTDKSKKIMLV